MSKHHNFLDITTLGHLLWRNNIKEVYYQTSVFVIFAKPLCNSPCTHSYTLLMFYIHVSTFPMHTFIHILVMFGIHGSTFPMHAFIHLGNVQYITIHVSTFPMHTFIHLANVLYTYMAPHFPCTHSYTLLIFCIHPWLHISHAHIHTHLGNVQYTLLHISHARIHTPW